MIDNKRQSYLSGCDVEDTGAMTFTGGPWRNDPLLQGLQPNLDRNPKINAKEQRHELKD